MGCEPPTEEDMTRTLRTLILAAFAAEAFASGVVTVRPRDAIVVTESESCFGISVMTRVSNVLAAASTTVRSFASILFHASLVSTSAPTSGPTRTSSMYFA